MDIILTNSIFCFVTGVSVKCSREYLLLAFIYFFNLLHLFAKTNVYVFYVFFISLLTTITWTNINLATWNNGLTWQLWILSSYNFLLVLQYHILSIIHYMFDTKPMSFFLCFDNSGDIPVDQVPQIVMLTFDDSVNDLNKVLYQDLFEKGRKNPNGCPITATFYVSHEWTDYSQVQNLYVDGHEMASHTVS